MGAGFDMQAEMGNLAERIVEPVTTKLAQKELDAAVDEIRHAFEQLSGASPAANVDFRNAAVDILEPVRSKLCKGDFTRIADRLRGAMAGFCQRDEGAAQPDGDPLCLQQAGQREALHLEQNAQSEPKTERWWGTS